MRQITETYFVSPQISPDDIPGIKDAGIVKIINNRPDMEIPPSHQSEMMEAAAKTAGIPIVHLPITHGSMTSETVARQKQIVAEAGGPVLAYCASGTRCSVIWALSMAGEMSADDILGACRNAGYDLEGLRPNLD